MSVLELQAGDVFEGFTVRRALGRGGMGAVYLVHHPRFATDMALKVMIIQAATEEELETHRARFTREARTLVRLRHQSIIRVHDFAEHRDEDGVSPYILMEFFPGVDGLKWVKTNPSLDRVRNVALQLADALACAHDAGVLHRDLKYGNILVNQKDEAVLIDFGIAKSEADETVTQTGLSVGTLSHMAPEYLSASMKGQSPEHTAKTDLWAFGCLLYFLSAHKNAFQSGGKGAAVLIRSIVEDAHVPVRSVRNDASIEWSTLIDDLLQKDPEKRIPTARELARRLQAITATTDPSAPAFVPPTPPGAQKTPTPGPSTDLFTPPPPSMQPTAQQRGVRVVTSDDPFAGAKAQPAPPSASGLELPPLDGLTGIGTAQAAVPMAAPAVAPKEATSSATAPRDPTVAPAGAAVPPTSSTSTAPLAAAASPNDGLGTFIASIKPDMSAPRAAPSPPSPSPVPVQVEDTTPRTGAFDLSRTTEQQDQSTVQPLPAFAPPAPKAATKQSALRALALPVAAVSVIAVVGLGGLQFLSSGAQPQASNKPSAAQVEQDEALKRAEERSAREIAALERAQKASAPTMAPLPSAPAPLPDTLPPPAPTTATTATTATTTTGGSRQGPTRVAATDPTPPPAAPAPAVDPVAARFGNRNFNTGAFGNGAETASTTPATTAGAASSPTAGVKIPVRVDTEIASANSPVIAIVTKETKVGGVTLPVGTQIHGTSSLGQGTRVTVQFRFAIVGGKNVPLGGVALAADGRAGIPGTRTMGNGTDVAARAAGAALAATADAAAQLAGDNPLGAAVRGGGGAAAGKSDRLNSDEDLVVVKRGARFSVYVGG